MPSSFSQILNNLSFSHYTDPGSIQRGRAYYKDGRVEEVDLVSDSKAICLVSGDSGEYKVEIWVNKNASRLQYECDCPYAEDGHFCKHLVAAVLAVKDYLAEGDEDELDALGYIPPSPPRPTPASPPRLPSQPWQKKLSEILALAPRQLPPHLNRYVAVVILERTRTNMYGYYGSSYQSAYNYALVPMIIKGHAWGELAGAIDQSPLAINNFLDTNHAWLRTSTRWSQQTNPAGCLNLNPEAISLLNSLAGLSRLYGFGGSNLGMFLPLLAKFEVPVFLGNTYSFKIDRRLQLLPEPIEVVIDLHSDEHKLVLQAGYEHGGQFTLIREKIETIDHDPTWLLMGNRVAQLQNTRALSLLPSFPIEVPAAQEDFFREQYFAQIAQTLPLKGDLIHWQDVRVDPIPRLYLHDDKGNTLLADLRYGYGEHELPATKTEEPYAVETVPDTWNLLRVHRQPQREQHYYQLLTDPAYGLKRAGIIHPFGTFELRARTHPFDFLLHAIPLLTQAGFEIYGQDNLKLGRLNRHTATLRVNITSGIDWFDLQTMVEFGDQQISFHAVRKALKRGERFIKLADGSVGQVPAEWLEQYKHLWNLGEETEAGFRLRDVHLPLLDSLLEADANLVAPKDLLERRERLRRFERIAPRALPKNFSGELRPYQKHGFDWLHFLRDYKFGGILADDMGLGKTVQMLVYLQSLKESAPKRNRPPASLLVVPKSLIANWQRESEKFTPQLRFLEYVGMGRSKDTTLFNDYDIVLTTYGTMLRDIELLRGYTFNHIILDESQAIKNPLAKSAKAARLLHGDHRLVMTGTPVENNTFELWSQFAFLNPGLLGNMDYFKKEFANRIEGAGDEAAATMLRKLIYPFILRRTKEQVAPELPPRTERVVYTDMDTAQKKLYIQTRERYRAELLGLIESDGMNDARFKILEGLLRLRQIAIHPALVDKKYKGDSPKFEILLETLETLQAENHKALIFSQFVETLKLIKRELDARKIKYAYLDGQTTNRQARVDSFQTDPAIPFFLISLKAGGVGLNLTAADYVIHLDPWWNPAVEMQASDRAHRIGQDKPVFVYKIIARDTVEEKILQLQEKKRALVTSLISTEASFFKSLTKDDVKMLFE